MSTEKPKHRVYTPEEQQEINAEGERLKYQITLQFETVFHEKYRNFDQAAEKIQNTLNKGKKTTDDDYFSISGATLSQYARGFTRVPDRKLVPICDALEIPTQSIRENDIYRFDEGHYSALLVKYLMEKYSVDVLMLARVHKIPESFIDDLLSMKHFNINEMHLDTLLEALGNSSEETSALLDKPEELIKDEEFQIFMAENTIGQNSTIRAALGDIHNDPESRAVFLLGSKFSSLVQMISLKTESDESLEQMIPEQLFSIMEDLKTLMKEKGVTLDDATTLKLIKLLTV